MFSGVSAENIKKNRLCALRAWFIYVKIFFDYSHQTIVFAVVSVTLPNPGI